MITFPNAKINLGLNIVARRPDGYHDIETVFYPIQLTDVLEIVPATVGADTHLHCYGNAVDCPEEKNLVMKACRLMQRHFNVPQVEMHLYKHIPDGAGLGGGSSDASSTMMMLRDMFHLDVSDDSLAELASTIGADCPFFIHNRPLMATGIGNVFSPCTVSLKGMTLLLVKPAVHVSTAEAYAQVVPRPSDASLTQLLSLPVSHWAQAGVANDFEPGVFDQHPQLAKIKDDILRSGAAFASMSGSGSSIFGIFDDAKVAENAAHQFAGTEHFVIAL